ncbi:aspartate/glutamate racemase family protein [Roseovarius sp. EL26]|uniref:aspartate/glutamate racemase family protein n=1 Tax=Roseovarius sp. EL26 TaxID=2126672 RepID=UPI000EA10CDD|nr:aspartate/glutamate racemase family protein [Roseovarius sp. EL26]
MHIGLIGGIGPAATIAYYRRLVEVFKAEDLPLKLTIVHADVSALASNATSGRRNAQAEIFVKHLMQLKGAGCDMATITALTGHFCYDEVAALSPLPVMSAIDPVDEYCAQQGIDRIGLLGSPSVLTTKLFGRLQKVHAVVPQTGVAELGDTYMKVALSGECAQADRDLFFAAGQRMIDDQGAEAILLAGTDLGLAFEGQTPGFPVIDALEIHVAAMVDLIRNEQVALRSH